MPRLTGRPSRSRSRSPPSVPTLPTRIATRSACDDDHPIRTSPRSLNLISRYGIYPIHDPGKTGTQQGPVRRLLEVVYLRIWDFETEWPRHGSRRRCNGRWDAAGRHPLDSEGEDCPERDRVSRIPHRTAIPSGPTPVEVDHSYRAETFRTNTPRGIAESRVSAGATHWWPVDHDCRDKRSGTDGRNGPSGQPAEPLLRHLPFLSKIAGRTAEYGRNRSLPSGELTTIGRPINLIPR